MISSKEMNNMSVKDFSKDEALPDDEDVRGFYANGIYFNSVEELFEAAEKMVKEMKKHKEQKDADS